MCDRFVLFTMIVIFAQQVVLELRFSIQIGDYGKYGEHQDWSGEV
jgi:hypothetical protein